MVRRKNESNMSNKEKYATYRISKAVGLDFFLFLEFGDNAVVKIETTCILLPFQRIIWQDGFKT